MTTQESDDPVKLQLLHQSERTRTVLEEEMKGFFEGSEKVVNTVLITAGVLALAFFLVTEINGGKKKRKKDKHKGTSQPAEAGEKEEPGLLTQVGATIATQVALFALEFGRERLARYLEERNQEKA